MSDNTSADANANILTSALKMLEEQRVLYSNRFGNAGIKSHEEIVPDVVAEFQGEHTPDFRFGLMMAGMKDALKGKKILVFGGLGDSWYKFDRWALDHLGVAEEDITIVDMGKVNDRLKYQYGNIEILTQDQVAADPSLLKGKGFDMAMVITPPKQHMQCIEQAYDLGLPIMVEKPAFTTVKEYDEFEAMRQRKQKEQNKPLSAYFMDWEALLALPLYAALGHEIPFRDTIKFKNEEKFKEFNQNGIKEVKVTFAEGRGNPLVASGHRGFLGRVDQGGGMALDLFPHVLIPLATLGFKHKEITDANYGTTTDKLGVYQQIGKESKWQNVAEWYARAEAIMDFNGRDISVQAEVGKFAYENDMRIELYDDKGNMLKYEFGHEIGEVKLFNEKGEELASDKGMADPYAMMMVQANHGFNAANENAQERGDNQGEVAYGMETQTVINFIEESTKAARSKKGGNKLTQLAMHKRKERKVIGKAGEYATRNAEYKEREIKASNITYMTYDNQYFWTAEGPMFDDKRKCFWFTDIENGLLCQYKLHPGEGEEKLKIWKPTADGVGKDGRPVQMIGGTTVINQDGNIIFMMDNGGANPGINMFNPDTEEFINIGKIPDSEAPNNRPNDITTIKVNDKVLMLVGTMNKDWHKWREEDGSIKRLGGFNLVDPNNFTQHKIHFAESTANGEAKVREPIITNGLADGGKAPDGNGRIVDWAETVEHAN